MSESATTSCQNLMEADEGSTGSSCGENVFVGMVREKSWNGTLWDRAVYIFRDAYTSFYRYGYAVLWSQWIFREHEAKKQKNTTGADRDDDEEGEHHLSQLLSNVHEFAASFASMICPCYIYVRKFTELSCISL